MTEIKQIRRKYLKPTEIADYWEYRCLKCDSDFDNCTYRIERTNGRRPASSHSRYWMFCDSGEPDCARCKKHLGCFDKTSAIHDCPGVVAERAHIIPRWRIEYGNPVVGADVDSLDEVANVILLCPQCHKQDPEPGSRQEYLEWLCAERDRLYYAKKRLYEAYEILDLDSPQLLEIVVASLPNYSDKVAHAARILGMHKLQEQLWEQGCTGTALLDDEIHHSRYGEDCPIHTVVYEKESK